MTMTLPLHPKIAARETALSFLSRLAEMNGLTSSQFASDMGISVKRIALLDEAALGTLAELGGLDSDALEEMVSWSGKPLGDVRTAFRGEIFRSRAIRSLTVRGCPVCLREDVKALGNPSCEAMVMRGHWQLRDLHLCVRHHHPLVALWTAVSPRQRSDIGTHLGKIADQLLDGKLDQVQRVPTDYDLWLDLRLDDGSDPTWLANQSLYAAVTFCGLLGEEILRVRGNSSTVRDNGGAAAAAIGFDVTKRGRGAIREALDDLAAYAGGALDGPNKAFGELYRHLGKAYLEEDSFALYRDLLRDCILDTWPIAAGTNVLGEVLPKRRLHSIHTASIEFGVGIPNVKHFLEAAGAIAIEDQRPIARKTFNAEKFEHIMRDVQLLIGARELRKSMGATLSQFNTLVKDEVIIPATPYPKIQSRWRLAEGIDLVTKLQAKAVPIYVDEVGWETLSYGRRRSGVRLKQIISAIDAGTIDVGQREGERGYGAICVRPDQIDGLELNAQKSRSEADLNLTAFCQAVGLRSTVKLRAFLEAGYSPATVRRHPTTGQGQFYLSEQDVATFHARFMTLATIEKHTGHSRKWIRMRLSASGTKYFAPNEIDFGRIFLRQDIKNMMD